MEKLGNETVSAEEAPVRTRSVSTVTQVCLYSLIIWITYFVVSTGVSPVLPAGVAVVSFVQMVRIAKKNAASLILKRKAKRHASMRLMGESSSVTGYALEVSEAK